MDFSRFRDLLDIIENKRPSSLDQEHLNQVQAFWAIVDLIPKIYMKQLKDPYDPMPRETIYTMIDALMQGASIWKISAQDQQKARQQILTHLKNIDEEQ